jgi:hypothetical protein
VLERKSLSEAAGLSGCAGVRIPQWMVLCPPGQRAGGMKGVELYAEARRAVFVEGISQRKAARRYGIDPRTVAKMLAFSVPPG